MKKIILSLLFVITTLLIVSIPAFPQPASQYHELQQGKNILIFSNLTQPIYAADFISINIQVIESISYFSIELNKSIGYVNVFNGVGQNFLLQQDVEYEVYLKNNLTIAI